MLCELINWILNFHRSWQTDPRNISTNTFCEKWEKLQYSTSLELPVSLVLFNKLKDICIYFFFIQIDKQLASGEYFLQEKERRLKAQQERKVSNLKQTSEEQVTWELSTELHISLMIVCPQRKDKFTVLCCSVKVLYIHLILFCIFTVQEGPFLVFPKRNDGIEN